MIRLFVLLGGIVIVAFVIALVAPPFINWNQFKPRFEQEASRLLGSKITVNGQTNVRLLPLPTITFEDVSVGDVTNPTVTIKQFYFNFEIAPLLRNQIIIADMVVSQPSLVAEIQEDGKINTVKFGEVGGSEVKFDAVKIEGGTAKIHDKRFKQDIVLNNINAIASAKTLVGPWEVAGTFDSLGKQFEVEAKTGKYSEEDEATKRINIETKIEVEDVPIEFNVQGDVFVHDVPHFSGKFHTRPAGNQGNNQYHIETEGMFGLSASGIVVSEYQARIGRTDPYRVKGNAFINFGSEFTINANGEQFAFERIEKDGQPKTLGERIALVREALNNIPIPKTKGSVVVNLPAFVAGDTVVRDVQLKAQPTQGGWDIPEFKAEMPGRTALIAKGKLTLGDAFGYEGEIVVASRQPTGLARWLRKEVPQEITNLKSAGMQADMQINQDGVNLQNMELILNEQQFVGSFQRTAGVDKGFVSAELKGQKLDVDQVIALVMLITGEDTEESQTNRQGGNDVSLKLEVEEIEYQGVKAKGLNTRINYNTEMLVVDNLNIDDIEGAKVEVSGSVRTKNPRTGFVSGSVSANNPKKILSLVNQKFGGVPVVARFINEPYLVNDAEVGFKWKKESVSTPAEIVLTGNAGGSDIKADIRMSEQANKAEVELSNEDAAILMLQLGMPVIQINEMGEGRFELSAEGDAVEGYEVETRLSAVGGEGAAKGFVQVERQEDEIKVEGEVDVSVKAGDVDPLLLLFGLPLPIFGEGYDVEGVAKIQVGEARGKARDVSLRLGQMNWGGEVALDLNGARPFVEAKINADRLDSKFLGELVFPDTEIEGEESLPVMAGLDGEVNVSVKRFLLPNNIDEVRNAQARLNISDGDLGFQNVSAEWLGGEVGGEVNLAKGRKTELVSGQVRINGTSLQKIAEVVGFAEDVASGKVDASIGFEAAAEGGKFAEGIIANGTINISDGSVNNLNSAAFLEGVIQRFDQKNSEQGDVDYSELQTAGMFNGEFKFGNASTESLVISNGVARIDGLVVRDTNMSATVNARLKLGTNEDDNEGEKLVADVEFEFNPKREKIIGATPEFSAKLFGSPQELEAEFNLTPLNTFLGMRAAERREREFETQKAAILERQRLLRQARIYELEEEAERQRIEFYERLTGARITQQQAEQEIHKQEAERKVREEKETINPTTNPPNPNNTEGG